MFNQYAVRTIQVENGQGELVWSAYAYRPSNGSGAYARDPVKLKAVEKAFQKLFSRQAA